MISLKKYLDDYAAEKERSQALEPLLSAYRSAYWSALVDMGSASVDACPALGAGLKLSLLGHKEKLNCADPTEVAAIERGVREQVRDWGMRAALHLKERTGEVRDLLLVLARTSESLANRDQRCAEQIGEVTMQLKGIATLEDLSQIRTLVERTAGELKTSINRMTAEGRSAVEHMRVEVDAYRSKLEAAESIAACDALTGLGNRLWIESQIENRIAKALVFSTGVLDIDGFKEVNDTHGHLAGDELLKQFAGELKNASRSSDILGRWGGDEFIVLLDSGSHTARSQIERLRRWVCGNYTIQGRSGPVKQTVRASIGIAEYRPGDTVQSLLQRADTEMYCEKARTPRHAKT